VSEPPQHRLTELLRYPKLIQMRDDLSLEVATLRNQMGQPSQALELLLHRKFQPWEGGEGLVVGQYVRARLLLGRRALEKGDTEAALAEFDAALKAPENLGEAKHLLANQNNIYYWLGEASKQLGQHEQARAWWQKAALQKGDFQQMSVRTISDMTYWSALAYQELGEHAEAKSIFNSIYEYSIELEATRPEIEYFATSLPAMLLLNEDLAQRNLTVARFLRAQGLAGLGRTSEAVTLLLEVLERDINHSEAADLLDQIRMSWKQAPAC